MASGIKNFLERNFTGILVTLGLAAVSSVVLHDKWEEEQARSQLLDKMAASDVTKLVCGLDKARPDLALTLAPLLEMEDRTTP